MLVFGAFWMITWLIGTNGYNSSTGGAILASNLVLALLATIVASVASEVNKFLDNLIEEVHDAA